MLENYDYIQDILSGEIFLLALTLGCFLLGVYLYKKTKISLLQPMIISIITIIPFLKLTGIDYQLYYEKTYLLQFMLGPSVVALGYVLYEQIEHVKSKIVSILISIIVGSITAIVSVVLIAKALGADQLITTSLVPKSVTAPIAMKLAENIGGAPSLAAVFVVICGVFGALVAPFILRLAGIKSPTAKGLAIGSSSHALGTSKAIELGAVEGAVSGLAIALMGVATALLIPFADKFLL